MKRILITAGYMGTGSSAMTDLLSEFKSVNNKYKDFEYIFLHCPGGIFDLEDKLLILNNSMRSDEALHAFRNTMKDLYDVKFWWPGNYKNVIGKNFMNIVDEYINSITLFKTDNFWYYQEKPTKVGMLKYIYFYILNKIFNNKFKNKKVLTYDKMFLSYIDSNTFYEKSKIFINNVIYEIDKSDDDILLDQLLLPHNAWRIDNYFDNNTKMFIVDRDPRDLFVLNKYVWSKKGISVPYSFDVKKFCIQYREIRKNVKEYNKKFVMNIQFEDLIYKYDDTLKNIMKFMSYSDEDHINKMNRFDPNKSIANTQVYLSENIDNEEIRYIEKELKEFLYDFPYQVSSSIYNTLD